MNNARRKAILSLIDKLNEIRDEIDVIKDEESDAYDCLPESLQDSEKGERMQYAIDALEEAYDQIDEAAGSLETAME